VRHRLGLATRTQISVRNSPFPSAGTVVSLFRAKTVQQIGAVDRLWKFSARTCYICCRQQNKMVHFFMHHPVLLEVKPHSPVDSDWTENPCVHAATTEERTRQELQQDLNLKTPH